MLAKPARRAGIAAPPTGRRRPLRLAASTMERSLLRDVSRPVLRLVPRSQIFATKGRMRHAPGVRHPAQPRTSESLPVATHPPSLRHCGIRGRGAHRRPAQLDAHLPCPCRRRLAQAVLLDGELRHRRPPTPLIAARNCLPVGGRAAKFTACLICSRPRQYAPNGAPEPSCLASIGMTVACGQVSMHQSCHIGGP